MQILCLAEQIQFTEDVERALKEQNLQQLELELNAKLEHYTTVDTSSDDNASTGSSVCACVCTFLNIYSICALLGWFLLLQNHTKYPCFFPLGYIRQVLLGHRVIILPRTSNRS